MVADRPLHVRWIVEDVHRPGGVERVVRELNAGLLRLGVDSGVWSWLPDQQFAMRSQTRPSRWWRAKWRTSMRRGRLARRMCTRIEQHAVNFPETVFVIDPGSIDVAARLSRRPRWLIHVHWAPDLILRPWRYVIPDSVPPGLGAIVDLRMRLIGRRNRKALRLAHGIVTISDAHRQTLSAINQRSKTIPNPLLIEHVQERSAPAPRAKIGYVGRLAWEKGFDVFLHAVPLVGDRSHDLSYVIVGAGPMRAQALALAGSVAPGRVTVSPWSDDVAATLMDIDVLVVPSRLDAGPMVLLEGLAAGCLIVASDGAGAAADLLTNSELGEVVAAEDVPGTAHAIERLVARVRAGGWSRSSVRRRALARHDPDVVLARWQGMLRELDAT